MFYEGILLICVFIRLIVNYYINLSITKIMICIISLNNENHSNTVNKD